MPDFRERVAWGHTTPRTARAAGLPNITGSFGYQNDFGAIANGSQTITPTGAFAKGTYRSNRSDGAGGTGSYDADFNASRCSSIYGKSTTVQPPALTTRFLIRAKS